MAKSVSLRKAKALLKVDESKLDKYLRYYQDEHDADVLARQNGEEIPSILTDTERQMLERYRRIFAMFNIGRTDEFIRDVLTKEYGIEWRQARNLVNQAYYIYGVIGEADEVGKRRASINYYRMLSNLATKNNDYETARKLWREADVLEGLYKEGQSGLNPDDFKHAPKFIYIDNVNILNQRLKELDPDD
jgi:hypothetical protein